MLTKEIISEDYPKALLCDGFDEAIIGMTYDEALEYYEFNIVGAWMGEFTPVFIKN